MKNWRGFVIPSLVTVSIVLLFALGSVFAQQLAPRGSSSGYGLACETPTFSALSQDVTQDEGVRRAMALFLLRNEVAQSNRTTHISQIYLWLRFQYSIHINREYLGRLFCESAWARSASGRPISSVPEIMHWMSPVLSQPEEAYIVSVYLVVERQKLPQSPDLAWITTARKHTKAAQMQWSRLYR